ncbi:MAG: aminopeptidase P family protein [Anaerolineae bacterium]
MSSQRLANLRSLLQREGLDWMLIESAANRRYLSGFTGSAGTLLISQEQAFLATDFRYYQQAEQQAPAFTLVRLKREEKEGLALFLHQNVAEGSRLAFEAEHLTVARHESLKSAVDKVEWVPTRGLVERLRAVKDEEELAAIRRAVALADEALMATMPTLRPAMTEREVAWRLETYMRERGASRVSFDIIVGSGPNGAKPHATVSDRALAAGEPIVIDMGCVVEGYCSDLTRTLVLGQPDGRFRELHSLVLQAQEAAERGMRAGMTGREADALARQVITAAGHAEEFGHSLGHGVGLEVHELPLVGHQGEDPLVQGMVCTVEPGVYLPDWGGIRIEDMVVVREDDVEVLTACTKDPVIPL